MARPGQFTLASLFLATAFIAMACAAVRYIPTSGKLFALPSIPIAVSAAVGVLTRRLKDSLLIGGILALILLVFVLP
ncbi:MAG TPA: hypothetical protein VGH32_09425 [Pirellulales bacterium]